MFSFFKGDELVIASVILALLGLLVTRHWKQEKIEPENTSTKNNIETLVREVKQSLVKLDEERMANDEESLLKISTFDLEINFVLKVSDSKDAKIELMPVTIGGKSDVSAEKTQKITLHFKAQEGTGPGEIAGGDEYQRVHRSGAVKNVGEQK